MPFLTVGETLRTVPSMQARHPDELPLVFQHHLNASELDGLLANYYADNAVYAPLPGTAVSGDDLRAAVARLVTLAASIDITVRHVLTTGDTALIVLDWEISAAGISGTATDVARRQEDGTWRCIVDNPHGTAQTVDLPPETAATLAG